MKTIKINDECMNLVDQIISIAVNYENYFNGKRKLGITGEIGEILACKEMNLKLALDSNNPGYDALDENNKKVQIKACRSETHDISPNKSNIGSFSKHSYDYALMILLGRNYKIKEIWKADYSKLEPILSKKKKSNPKIREFKKVAELVYPQ